MYLNRDYLSVLGVFILSLVWSSTHYESLDNNMYFALVLFVLSLLYLVVNVRTVFNMYKDNRRTVIRNYRE